MLFSVEPPVERLERLLAQQRGDEYAEPIDLRVTWDPNIDETLLVHQKGRARLVLPARLDDLDQRRVVIEWSRCHGAVLSGPNDEARNGHRLWSAGLRDCTSAAEVFNSRWVRELELVNSVHPHHRPEFFAGARHFVVLLKESTFECVADDYAVSRLAPSSM
jgi:hypothetical protein